MYTYPEDTMATTERMCSYHNPFRGYSLGHRTFFDRPVYDKRQKRVRVQCPECGRRMFAWAAYCDDGCYVSYIVPKHKKKAWWKKPKKQIERRMTGNGK
jgi:hypothetical protein